MTHSHGLPAEEALQKLKTGNKRYLETLTNPGDVSPDIRIKTRNEGQTPFAIIIACSDSRVIPEAIFSCGIGDLFVIRLAGNVIDKHQLGSIEYAVQHLGCNLVVVLGHTHCGAVDAAMHGEAAGYTKSITDEIRLAIGDEENYHNACCLNALHSSSVIRESLIIQGEEKHGLKVTAAVYDIETGKVEHLPYSWLAHYKAAKNV